MNKKIIFAIIMSLLITAGFISGSIPNGQIIEPEREIVHAKVNDPVPQIMPIPTPEPTPEPSETPVTTSPVETEKPVTAHSEASQAPSESIDTIAMMAITMRNESNGSTPEESMKVGWCICNRAMNWGQSIAHVIASPHQFAYYGGGLYSGYWYELATYVITDYRHERNGEPYEYYGRLLSSDMMWFRGDGYYNHFYNYCPY